LIVCAVLITSTVVATLASCILKLTVAGVATSNCTFVCL
jgi:hypothetical protein